MHGAAQNEIKKPSYLYILIIIKMGQYYRVVLVDNVGDVKVIKPDGYKMMEHSWYGTKTMDRVQQLLFRDSKNIMWVGDYSKIYSLVRKHEFKDMEEISWDKALPPDQYLNIAQGDNIDKNFYLVNKSAYEFINMTKQMMNKELTSVYGSTVHPLPLLCRVESEDAGGDYHSEINREHIGKWCGDIISIYSGSYADEVAVELEAQGYKDMTNVYFFKE